MMIRSLLAGLLFLTVSSCVKIPVQSVELADALLTECTRMHKVNLMLVNHLFNVKKAEVDSFIRRDYTPAAIRNFTSLLPETVDYKKDFNAMMNALMPKINSRRDSLVRALDLTREMLIMKMNKDHSAFTEAATTLKKYLESAVKADREKTAMYAQVKELTKNRLDVSQLEKALGDFMQSAGSAGDKISGLQQSLELFYNP